MQDDKRIQMIALDLDGTTFNSRGQLSDHTRETLEKAGKQGVYVVISTGRSYNSLPDHIKNVKGIAYAITSNGAHINDVASGTSIYDSYLSETAVKAVEALSKDMHVGIEVFINGQAYIDEYTYNDIRENGSPFRNAEYVLWSRKPVKDIYALLLENSSRIENINLCFDSPEHLEKERAKVESIPEASITSSIKNNLEVGGPDTSKKTALIELMRRLGISRENLMCCGDAPNDIPMLQYAGLGVAVANAWGGTLDHADYVTVSNDDDGVALAIEKFVLKQ